MRKNSQWLKSCNKIGGISSGVPLHSRVTIVNNSVIHISKVLEEVSNGLIAKMMNV
jgi:hypothetical protein